MRVLLNDSVEEDLKLCKKKDWHNGLAEELLGVYRLLKKYRKLPGEYPVKGLGEKWGGVVMHAYVALPKEGVGGRKGGRIVYAIIEDQCRVIYVGGHKDKRYDNSHNLSKLVLERIEGSRFYTEWIDD